MSEKYIIKHNIQENNIKHINILETIEGPRQARYTSGDAIHICKRPQKSASEQ
jgi:hypothetical protein